MQRELYLLSAMTDMHNIAILHPVVLAFEAQRTLASRDSFGARC